MQTQTIPCGQNDNQTEVDPVLHIEVVKDPKRLKDIYEMRYRIYVGEMKLLDLYGDRPGFIVDDEDMNADILGVYTSRGMLVGSMRINYGSRGSSLDSKMFDSKLFECALPRLAYCSKFFIAAAFRRRPRIYISILNKAFRLIFQNGATRTLLTREAHLSKMYRRMGFVQAGEVGLFGGMISAQPMILDNSNVDYLKSIGSPLAAVAVETYGRVISN